MKKYNKAIAAAVAGIASVLIAFNIDVSQELQGAIVVVLTGLVTALSPKNAG